MMKWETTVMSFILVVGAGSICFLVKLIRNLIDKCTKERTPDIELATIPGRPSHSINNRLPIVRRNPRAEAIRSFRGADTPARNQLSQHLSITSRHAVVPHRIRTNAHSDTFRAAFEPPTCYDDDVPPTYEAVMLQNESSPLHEVPLPPYSSIQEATAQVGDAARSVANIVMPSAALQDDRLPLLNNEDSTNTLPDVFARQTSRPIQIVKPNIKRYE